MASVLIVEDELDLADAWRATLMLDDHDVVIAHTGAEAFELMKAQSFDVVLTDLKMPDGGGMYVSGMTRMLLGHSNIIVVSGYLTPSISGVTRRDALASLGVRRFLSKPVSAEDLRQAVKEAAEDSESPGEASSKQSGAER